MNLIKLMFFTIVYFLLVELGVYFIKTNNEGFDFDQKKKSFLVIIFAIITNGFLCELNARILKK